MHFPLKIIKHHVLQKRYVNQKDNDLEIYGINATGIYDAFLD